VLPCVEADIEQQQAQAAARKRVAGYYDEQLPPELPLPEGAYASPEQQQQQLARLKVRLLCSWSNIVWMNAAAAAVVVVVVVLQLGGSRTSLPQL
jgi:hypothetical protein